MLTTQKLSILLLYFLTSFTALAQVEDYNIQFFSTEQGLLHNHIQNIHQDEKGIIWVGTMEGLNRFDGQEFTPYQQLGSTFNSNKILNITEDKKNRFWLLNSNLNAYEYLIFEKNKEKGFSIKEYFTELPFSSKDKYSMIEDPQDFQGIIWFFSANGELYKYDDNFEFLFKVKEVGFRNLDIIDDKIWLIYPDKIQIYDYSGDLLNTIIFEATEYAHKIYKFGDRLYLIDYFYKGYKIHVFDLNTKSLVNEIQENFKSGQTLVFSGTPFLITKENENLPLIWMGGPSYLKCFDEKNKQEVNFSNALLDQLKHFSVTNIFQDRSNNIWVGTENGLVLISLKKKLFNSFLTGQINKYNSIRGMEEYDEDQLFVSGYIGNFLLDKNTKDTIHIFKDKNRGSRGFGTLQVGDTILLGHHDPQYWVFDKKKKIAQNYFYNDNIPLSISENTYFLTKGFYKDKLDQIWVITSEGLFQLNKDYSNVIRPPQVEKNILPQKDINFIFENNSGLWVSCNTGIYLLDYSGAIIEEFEELNQYIIHYIHQNKKGEFWLATERNGLLHWNRTTRKIQQFTKDKNLSDNFIVAIIEDDYGMFWLPSYNGLVRFNPENFTTNIFYEEDGIAHNEFNRYSYLKTKSGEIYLGGLNGITSFDPSDFLYLDSINTPLIVSDLKKVKIDEMNYQDIPVINNNVSQLTLQPNDRSLKIKFGLLDYEKNFNSSFVYKIEGYDKNWFDLSSNELTIGRLPYGEYRLKVKAKGANETWSKKVLDIPLTVATPFYLTWQFLLSLGLALIGLSYGVFRYRLNTLEKRNLALEQVVAERTKELAKNSEELAELNQTKDQFFAIIAHDMRGLVSSFKDISKKINFLQRKGRKEEVDDFLQSIDKAADNLSNLLDNLLNWALVEKGVFPYHPELFNLEKVVIENIKLFTQLSRIKGVSLQYNVHETINIYADKNAVSTIIRNLISNAMKYSYEEDEIIINALKKDEKIQIQIIDSGEGIASNQLERIFRLDSKKTTQGTMGEHGTGLGLVLCKELAQLNNGDIKIESEEGEGTRVYVNLPLTG